MSGNVIKLCGCCSSLIEMCKAECSCSMRWFERCAGSKVKSGALYRHEHHARDAQDKITDLFEPDPRRMGKRMLRFNVQTSQYFL